MSSPFFVSHLVEYRCRLCGAGNFAGLKALGAHTLSLGCAILKCANGLQVRQPSALRLWGAESPRS